MDPHSSNTILKGAGSHLVRLRRPLRFLSIREVTMIDRLLSSLGPAGEVSLTVQKGRLRFMSTTTRHENPTADKPESEPREG